MAQTAIHTASAVDFTSPVLSVTRVPDPIPALAATAALPASAMPNVPPTSETPGAGAGVTYSKAEAPASNITILNRASASHFDINEGYGKETNIRLPSAPGNFPASDAATYAAAFENIIDSPANDSFLAAAKSLGIEASQISKAGPPPPSAFTYGRLSYMPDSAVNGGVLQWPGIVPDALSKIVRENIAPQLIIGMRCDDVLRYSNWSNQIWMPGWRIEPKDSNEEITSSVKKDIAEAVRFLHNGNMETGYTEARTRDKNYLTSFQRFLSAGTRDSLTFDGIALWTDMSRDDKVKSFTLLPAGNIRLTVKEGYNGNPDNFAVAVDDGGRIIQAFTRDELTFYVRNPRNNPDIAGYGLSEIELAMRVIAGVQNNVDLNLAIFDKNATPNGILTISGGSVTQRQLDLLNRLFTNMKKGISKSWALPVIGLQGDAKLELLDMSRMTGKEVMFKELLNMLIGMLCTVYRFPVRRLGYRISGGHHDAEPPAETSTVVADEDDPGLAPLLGHWESLINEYLIWSRWPHLRFIFTGKRPAENAREYEARSLARTWGEKRQEASLDSLDKVAPAGLSWFGELMAMCPSDPNLSSVFSTLAAIIVKDKLGVEDGKGGADGKPQQSEMSSKKDPAVSAQHGHAAGVRRDSAAERSSAEKKT